MRARALEFDQGASSLCNKCARAAPLLSHSGYIYIDRSINPWAKWAGCTINIGYAKKIYFYDRPLNINYFLYVSDGERKCATVFSLTLSVYVCIDIPFHF